MLRRIVLTFSLIGVLNGQLYAQQADTAVFKPKWYQSKVFKVTFAPAVLATGSLILFDPNGGPHTIISDIPGFNSYLDDYLQFVPIAIVYGMDIAGVEAKNDALNQSLMLLKAEAIMLALVYPLKYITNVPRPNGASNHSFPSGHTAQAFVAATFMHKEFGHLSIWYSIGAYAMATTTGVFRILKNKHRLTDVLMGAGIGILATNIAYATHRYKRGRKPRNFSLLPTYGEKTFGLYFQLYL